jgi:hypothetical protein
VLVAEVGRRIVTIRAAATTPYDADDASVKQQCLRDSPPSRYDQSVFGRPVSVLTKQLLYH